MRVFVAGGTGVIGRRLVPQLVARGHQVTATTTSAGKLGLLEQLGAEGVVMDGLDAAWVGEAVAAARPDVIVNQMTGLSVAHAGKANLRKADRFFATTNRLRSEGIDHLLAAAEATGVSHVVAQGHASMNGIRQGGWVKTEEDPLEVIEGTRAINHLEDVAVFVLRDVFGFGFSEIASAVDRSEAACRQLAVRARRHMDDGRPRFEADRREREELAARFLDALRDGDIDGLRELLAADVEMVGDGGGKAPAFVRSVIGADNVARVLDSILPVLARIDARVEPRGVNGQPGAILRDRHGKVVGTLALDVLGGRIQTIRSVVNPDKLGHVGPVADAWAFARELRQARRPRD